LKFFFVNRVNFKVIYTIKKIKLSKQVDFYTSYKDKGIFDFSKFFLKNGSLLKSRILLSNVLSNFNNFIYFNNFYILNKHPNSSWIVNNILEKKHNFSQVFGLITNLVKPPFVVKSILVPKKLRKKTKKKYLIKIVYKNESKRIKSAYKQLYYYSNKFNDSKFNVRLYKSLMFSFLDWKDSYLFKLKTMIFKKFFKF
jgi:hypothetical protein